MSRGPGLRRRPVRPGDLPLARGRAAAQHPPPQCVRLPWSCAIPAWLPRHSASLCPHPRIFPYRSLRARVVPGAGTEVPSCGLPVNAWTWPSGRGWRCRCTRDTSAQRRAPARAHRCLVTVTHLATTSRLPCHQVVVMRCCGGAVVDQPCCVSWLWGMRQDRSASRCALHPALGGPHAIQGSTEAQSYHASPQTRASGKLLPGPGRNEDAPTTAASALTCRPIDTVPDSCRSGKQQAGYTKLLISAQAAETIPA